MRKKKQVNKTDFLVTDLPSNRRELFFDILKNQWRNLLILSLIFLILFLPLVISRYYNLIIINNIVNSGSDDIGALVFNSSFGYNFIVFIILIIVGIFYGGIARIYKKLAYNEGFFLGADFVKGIKENFKDYTFFFALYGILNLIIETLCINFLLENNYLYYFFKVINYATLLPIFGICLSLGSIYTDSVFKKIKVACQIYIKYLFKILLMVAIFILPLALLLINSTSIQLFVPLIYSILYFPLAYLVFVLVLNSIFDEVINKKNFPNLVGKGMYRI